MTEVSGVTDHVEAVALAYCTDQPLRLTGEFPALKISMKSFRNGAPEFPPPPKIWLITMCGDVSGDGVGDGLGVGVAVGVGLGDGVGEALERASVWELESHSVWVSELVLALFHQ